MEKLVTIMALLLLGLLLGSRISAFRLPSGFKSPDENERDIIDLNMPFKSAVPNVDRLWPGGRVPYRISMVVGSMRSDIEGAMEHIQEHTCIRFVEALTEDTDFINVTPNKGCWSHVGQVGGGQELSLDPMCGRSKGVVLHELLHALGMWHEHARSDRDRYIVVLWDNIQEERKANFVQKHPWENNLLDEEFDFDSVMMYGRLDFSKDGVSPTLRSSVTDKQLVDLADKTSLSPGDIRKINKLYECGEETRPTPIDVPTLECHFEHDDCGFTSQDDETLHKWILQEGPEGGMSISWPTVPTQEQIVAGRLFSTYLKSFHRTTGCLSFRYRLSGSSLKVLVVTQQTEIQTKSLHVTDEQETDTGGWRQMALEVSLADDFRFIFEGVILSGSPSDVIEIDDLIFNWKSCS